MNLPENLRSANNEFIAIDGELFQIKISLIPFRELDIHVLESIGDKIDLVAEKALDQLGYKDPINRIEKFAICNFGGFDNAPDISASGGHTTEFYNCGHRGTCPVEGKLCKHLKVDNGFLTFREIEICRLISKDKYDKEIADILGISINTVQNHIQNIHAKTGLSKPGIAAFAIEKNL